MGQSFANVHIHIVFSTKLRQPLITKDLQPPLHRYLATIARNRDCPVVAVGGVEDHVHIACELSRSMTIAKLVEDLKRCSSYWMKSEMKCNGFQWQNGYAAFGVSKSHLNRLRRYILHQEEHHRQRDFDAEYALLTRPVE